MPGRRPCGVDGLSGWCRNRGKLCTGERHAAHREALQALDIEMIVTRAVARALMSARTIAMCEMMAHRRCRRRNGDEVKRRQNRQQYGHEEADTVSNNR